MKEYLVKNMHGEYKVTDHHSGFNVDDLIEIPEGADTATLYNGYLIFWKNDVWSFSKKDGDTEFVEGGDNMTLSEYLEWYEDTKIIWQRSETEYLMQGKNGERLVESVGQLKDNVNQPSHYTSGGIECLEAMQAMLSRDEFIGFLRGNVFKYNWRYKLKNGIEDLKKAQFYQNKLIELESDDAI